MTFISLPSSDKHAEYNKLISQNRALEEEKQSQIKQLKDFRSKLTKEREDMKDNFEKNIEQMTDVLHRENVQKLRDFLLKEAFPWAWKRMGEHLRVGFFHMPFCDIGVDIILLIGQVCYCRMILLGSV